MPIWEESLGQTKDTLKRFFSQLAWECPGISLEDLWEVAGETNVWVSLLRQLPLRHGLGYAAENKTKLN